MLKELSLLFMLVFFVNWVAFIVLSIRVAWINEKIKKLLKQEFPSIRYEFGKKPKFSFTYRLPRLNKELFLAFFKFGSRKSVKYYFKEFMDLESIYNTKHSQLISYMNQMFSSQQFAFRCFLGMFISVGLAFLFNWLN
tara:strand:- start:2682 stop:3095 length:414 start_codon:yes stop_codon:yes gene_type:complete